MTWLSPTATSTGTLMEIMIGTSTSGPPVPLIDDKNPVTAPTISSRVLDRARSGLSATLCAFSELSPDENVRRPRQASSNRGLTTLTAHAPTNAVGAAPAHNHVAMPHRMDLLCAKTAVATRPDRTYAIIAAGILV